MSELTCYTSQSTIFQLVLDDQHDSVEMCWRGAFTSARWYCGDCTNTAGAWLIADIAIVLGVDIDLLVDIEMSFGCRMSVCMGQGKLQEGY